MTSTGLSKIITLYLFKVNDQLNTILQSHQAKGLNKKRWRKNIEWEISPPAAYVMITTRYCNWEFPAEISRVTSSCESVGSPSDMKRITLSAGEWTKEMKSKVVSKIQLSLHTHTHAHRRTRARTHTHTHTHVYVQTFIIHIHKHTS